MRAVLLLLPLSSMAEQVSYSVDPEHTFPSFEADHNGGLSVWRGKFKKTRGRIVIDRAAETGTVFIETQISSIDFGVERLNSWATSSELLDYHRFPSATFAGILSRFENGKPTEVSGILTLHGVSRPLLMHINQFLCKPDRWAKVEVCGADASAIFNRADYGVTAGIDEGFLPEVRLQIQIEALQTASTKLVR